jgi:hypothetical protein
MRGCVCPLQVLPVLVSAVIPGSESNGTHGHILLYQIRESLNLKDEVPYLYLPGTALASYTPRHWVPFSLPPTTRWRYSNPSPHGDLILAT